MLAQIRSIAYRLTQEEIAFGDRVALIGENHPNWAIAYLGIIYRGAVVTPMDPAATTQALSAFLKGRKRNSHLSHQLHSISFAQPASNWATTFPQWPYDRSINPTALAVLKIG